MVDFVIDVYPRQGEGKGAARRARREGMIPGVAYHKGEENRKVNVPYKEFVRLASQARKSQVFTFRSESQELNGKSVLVKDLQKDFLANKVIHIDFLTLKENEVIRVVIPVHLKGESPGVKNQNGVLALVTHEIAVRCLPRHIPNAIELDISGLNLGESFHAKDITLPANVELVTDEDETIVSVVAPRSAEEEAAASATPAAEGAAAPAAAAPAAEEKKGGK